MSIDNQTVALSEIPAPGLNEVQRITGVFYQPSKTFQDLNRSANWFYAWLVIYAFSLLFTISVGQKIGWQQVQDNSIKLGPASRREQLEKLPPDQHAQQMKIGLVFTKVISYGFPVLVLIWLVIVALILWITFSFGLGAEINFAKSLAIVVFASLPGILHALMATLVVWAGVDPETFNIQNAVGTNPGWYMNILDSPRFVYNLATSLDVFILWTLFLTGLGFSVVAKVKKGTAMAVVYGWWALVTLIFSAIGAAFS